MGSFIYWCLRGLGYLFFALCSIAWIISAGCGVFLLIRLASYLVMDQTVNAVAVIVYALFGYILLLIGRFFVRRSLKIRENQ